MPMTFGLDGGFTANMTFGLDGANTALVLLALLCLHFPLRLLNYVTPLSSFLHINRDYRS